MRAMSSSERIPIALNMGCEKQSSTNFTHFISTTGPGNLFIGINTEKRSFTSNVPRPFQSLSPTHY